MGLPSFDMMSALFHSDPIAFEKLRKDLIEREICKAPPEKQLRLRGLQFQIDAIRQTSKTPLACCVVIQQMLHDKAGELLAMINDGYRPAQRAPFRNNILLFRSRDGHRQIRGDASPPAD